MPELASSVDYDLLFSGLTAASKQDDAMMTSNSFLSLDGVLGLSIALDMGAPPLEQSGTSSGSMREPSNVSTPSTFVTSPSVREASVPLDSPPMPDLAQLFMAMSGSSQSQETTQTAASPVAAESSIPTGDTLTALVCSLTAGLQAPPPTCSAASAAPSTVPSHASPSNGLDYGSVCQSLKEMTASGTPVSAILQFVKLSRAALGREIPAEVVLEGLLEREKRASPLQGKPTAGARGQSPLVSLGVSGIGPERHARHSLRAAASPYEIPPGPRVYQCDQCPLVFDRAYNLKEHLKTHDPRCNKRFPCPLGDCPHASHRRADIHRHIKNVHIKREGLSETQKELVLKLYPAMQPDLYPNQEIFAIASPSAPSEDGVDWKALVKTD